MPKKNFLLVIYCLFLISCAYGPVERIKSFLGVSTRSLEEARVNGVSEVFAADIDTCYEKAIEVLQAMPARIYMQNRKKYVLVAMGFERQKLTTPEESLPQDPLNETIDTTELGVFFQHQDKNKTKVEISSLSTSLLEFARDNFFPKLKTSLKKID